MSAIDTLRERAAKTAEFCQEKLWPLVDAHNEKHKIDLTEFRRRLKQCLPLIVGGLATVFIATHSKTPSEGLRFIGLLGYLALGVSAILLGPEIRKNAMKTIERFKAQMFLQRELKQRMISYLDPSFRLNQNPTFPEKTFQTCDLFDSSCDLKRAYDEFHGTIGETKFVMTEIGTFEKKTTRDSKGKTQVTYVPLFRGLLFKAEFNKNFHGQTFVKTDRHEKSFGRLARAAQRIAGSVQKSRLVELESPDFEATFKVTSTDSTEARYILTPDFMERLLSLKNRRGVAVQAAFVDSEIILAVPHPTDFFELKHGPEDLTRSCEHMASEFVEIIELVDLLDLGNRLSKPQTPRQVGAS